MLEEVTLYEQRLILFWNTNFNEDKTNSTNFDLKSKIAGRALQTKFKY